MEAPHVCTELYCLTAAAAATAALLWCNPTPLPDRRLDVANLISFPARLFSPLIHGRLGFPLSSAGRHVWLLSVHPFFNCGASDVSNEPLGLIELIKAEEEEW